MNSHIIRKQIREEYPRIDKYSLNAIAQRIERGVVMGVSLTVEYVRNSVVAFVRHNKTAYESKLQGHMYSSSRAQARYEVAPVISQTLNQWKGIK